MSRRVDLDRSYYSKQSEMYSWCLANFGSSVSGQTIQQLTDPQYRWAYTTVFGYTHFEFRDDEDYILFVLRWVKNDATSDS